MNLIEQEVNMLKSGALGDEIDLPWLVENDLLTKESCRIYLEWLGASNTGVASNDNKLFISLQNCYASL
jgi:hypothetical protein